MRKVRIFYHALPTGTVRWSLNFGAEGFGPERMAITVEDSPVGELIAKDFLVGYANKKGYEVAGVSPL